MWLATWASGESRIPLPEEVYFVRSDQYSFILQGVPSIYIGEGCKP